MLERLRDLWNRRSVRRVLKEREEERDACSSKMIDDLQNRKDAAEGFLLPRQQRNHWQEAISTMIHSGRSQ